MAPVEHVFSAQCRVRRAQLRSIRKAVQASIVASGLLTGACDAAPVSGAPALATAQRYEFTKGADGRVLRLDKVTGEVTAVERNQRPRRPQAPPPQSPAAQTAVPSPEVRHEPPAAQSSNTACELTGSASNVVTLAAAPVYLEARELAAPLATVVAGVLLPVKATIGEWFEVEFQHTRLDYQRVYVHCSQVRPLDVKPISSNVPRPTDASIPPVLGRNTPQPTVVGKPETVEGYLEWIKDNYIVVDGQRVRWTSETKMRLGRIESLHSTPLGYEVTARVVRLSDGSFLAGEIGAKPNGIASFEREVVSRFDDLERLWVQEGMMFLSGGKTRQNLGEVEEEGADAERVRRIMENLLPPYLSQTQIRVRVVNSDEWNASAMANGAIWVYRGLLKDASDDELAVVLGHELAHYTHEHSRREEKNNMWRQFAAAGAAGALGQMNSDATRESLVIGARLALNAWGSGYSRNLEDQADRVGLRYAYEAGFDVAAGPKLWSRMRAEYGEEDRVKNWFAGSHSRPSDRIKNLEREIALNYGR